MQQIQTNNTELVLSFTNSSLILSPTYGGIASITESNMQLAILILQSSQYDINKCLLNCSNIGICKLNTQTNAYYCECEKYFVGTSCQTDTRFCISSNPCLNNGSCIVLGNNTSFRCECGANYYGIFCEKQVDYCLNRTCSSHGYCLVNATVKLAQCRCYRGFSGDDCELRDEASFKARSCVQFVSVALAIASLLTVAFFVVTMDVLKYFGIRDSIIKSRNDLMARVLSNFYE